MSEMQTMPLIGGGLAPEGATARPGRGSLEAAASEFEAVFIAQMLQSLTSDLEGDGPLGGGEGDPFRRMLTGEIAKLISRASGVGVGDAVLQEMLKMQEVA
jgi:flagellar protein FlgJ